MLLIEMLILLVLENNFVFNW